MLTQRQREALIQQHLYIVDAEAGKHYRKCPSVAREDHWSAGAIGLVKAAQRYDPSRGMAFTTLAGWWVRGEIRHQIRDWGRVVRLAPPDAGIQTVSLDAHRPFGQHPDGYTLADTLLSPADTAAQAFANLEAADLASALGDLDSDWGDACRLVLLEGWTWSEFAASRGWSKGQAARFVRQFRAGIADRLRDVPHIAELAAGGICRIPLTNGGTVIVDARDAGRIAAHRWHGDPRGFAYRMAKRGLSRRKVRLHHAVVGRVPDGKRVVARNRNLLDCRRANLAIVPPWQAYAGRRHRDGKSGFRGVYYNAELAKWGARLTVNGVSHYLGGYGSPALAARAYDTAARQRLGDFASLNFPDTAARSNA